MPSKPFVLVIVAFWVSTMAWLWHRELRFLVLPGQPPPYSIDLADEAGVHQVRWEVYQGEQRMGYAKTGVEYREGTDDFMVYGTFRLWNQPAMRGQADRIVETRYVVTREGALRELNADLTVKLLGHQIEGHVSGKVRDQRFIPHIEITEGQSIDLKQDLPAVTVADQGSVLNALQPVNRIAGLRPGQHWQIPLMDPLSDLASSVTSSFKAAAPPKVVEAEVAGEVQTLHWNGTGVPCLVIDYSGAEFSGRTWVRASDGLVLRQEASHQGEELTLQRD